MHIKLEAFDFIELRLKAGLSTQQCATLFNVTQKNIQRWDNGKNVPKAVILVLQIYAGDLSFLGKAWKGFAIKEDCIEAPNGEYMRAQEVYAIKWLWQAANKNRGKLNQSLKQRYSNENSEESKIINLDKVYKLQPKLIG